MQLRPHQQDALTAMLAHDKGQVIVPTGGGKTMCMIKDSQEYLDACDRGIVVVVGLNCRSRSAMEYKVNCIMRYTIIF